jgi:hypothetical protein
VMHDLDLKRFFDYFCTCSAGEGGSNPEMSQ